MSGAREAVTVMDGGLELQPWMEVPEVPGRTPTAAEETPLSDEEERSARHAPLLRATGAIDAPATAG